MLNKEKLARAGVLIYSIIGLFAILISVSRDYIPDLDVTWAMYVVYGVSFLFLILLPLCFKTKYSVLISGIVLSAGTLPLLYLIDGVSMESNWFVPLARPLAVIVLGQLWVFGVLLRFVKLNKWFMLAVMALVFGALTGTAAMHYVSVYLDRILSPYISLRIAAAAMGVAVLFTVTGIVLKLVTEIKNAIARKRAGV